MWHFSLHHNIHKKSWGVHVVSKCVISNFIWIIFCTCWFFKWMLDCAGRIIDAFLSWITFWEIFWDIICASIMGTLKNLSFYASSHDWLIAFSLFSYLVLLSMIPFAGIFFCDIDKITSYFCIACYRFFWWHN